MYEKVVYVGQMDEVKALDHDFVKNVAVPVPPRLAQRLKRSPEFISEADYLARNATPTPPAEEPVTEQSVNAPDAVSLSAPKSKAPTRKK